MIVGGQDPIKVKQEEKQQAILNAENSFEAIAKEWHDNNIDKWEKETGMRIWRRLENNIFPSLGKKPLKEIKPSEVLAAIRVMENAVQLIFPAKLYEPAQLYFAMLLPQGKQITTLPLIYQKL